MLAERNTRGGGADCAVGSGEWAEPPHYPWTFRRRSGKNAIFWAFFDPFPGRGRSCFGACVRAEEARKREPGKPIPLGTRPPGTQVPGVYGPLLTESGRGQPGRVPAQAGVSGSPGLGREMPLRWEARIRDTRPAG